MPNAPLLLEIDLVRGDLSHDRPAAFATVHLGVVPRIGEELLFEPTGGQAAGGGAYRVVGVAYHVRPRRITSAAGDLLGISLTVIPVESAV